MEANNGLLTPEEAAQYLKVDVRTIYRWVRNGDLPAARIAGTLRIRKADIDAFFEKTKE